MMKEVPLNIFILRLDILRSRPGWGHAQLGWIYPFTGQNVDNNNLGGSVLLTCECCTILDSVADWIVS